MKLNQKSKTPFYIKYLNVICYGVSIFFFLFTLLIGYYQYSKEKDFYNQINQMLEYCNNLNSTIENNKNENFSDNENIKQIYFDGKTAIIDSYNKSLINSNSLEVEASGKIKLSSLLGLYTDIQMDFLIERYNKSKVYEEVYANVIKSNLPTLIIKKAKSGIKRLKIDENPPLFIKTNKVGFQGTKIVANFSEATSIVKEDEMFFNENSYIVNEDTILEVTYFKVNKTNNEIKNYYVQVKLDPQKSIIDYAKVISQQVDCNIPTFKSIIMTAIIDSNGNMISFTCNDDFNLKIEGFDAKAQSSMTYKISGINKENNFEYFGF